MHAIVSDNGRREVQTDAELLELHRNPAVTVSTLPDGDRELAAREKTGLLAALCDEVWLRQALKQAALLQRLDHELQVVPLAEEKQIQEVAEAELAGRAGDGRAEVAAVLAVLEVAETWRRELLR